MKLIDPDHIDGPVETIEVDGRKGLQPLSVHTRLQMKDHTLNQDRGALKMWVLPREDLSSVPPIAHIHQFEPRYTCYPLISDQKDLRNWPEASFALIWDAGWYPQYFAKFYKGTVYSDGFKPPRAIVMAGHLHLHRDRWVELGLTWDKTASDYRLYVNGVLISVSNCFEETLEHHPCGDTLYLGDLAYAYGEYAWFDHHPEFPLIETEDTPTLQRTYAGVGLPALDWSPTAAWTPTLDLPLNREEDLQNLYVQGNTNAHTVTDEGMEVRTPPDGVVDPNNDNVQVYFWTRKMFTGDLALEFEFKLMAPNGLSLLMLQASGMHGEDFMADYPLRTNGSMRMVYGENVRNYHWEYYREMEDTRNDVASCALIKQPWQYPLGYGCLDHRLALHEWHKLQFVQEGSRLRGALDGIQVFDVEDPPFQFAGGTYCKGHLAIRCMKRTHIVYRNLKVWNRM